MPEPDEIKSPAKTIMISLPGGASILNVLQLVEHLRKQEGKKMRYNTDIIIDRLIELTDEYKKQYPRSGKFKDLAREMGMSYATLINLRRYEFVPSTRIIYSFCKKFNVSADWVLGLKEERR
jgi:transcriptional regulator with XRE-family HTH domain